MNSRQSRSPPDKIKEGERMKKNMNIAGISWIMEGLVVVAVIVLAAVWKW